MFDSLWSDVKRQFSYGNMVTRLIIINAVIFVAVNLLKLILRIANAWEIPEFYTDLIYFFSMASDLERFLTHPWGLVTSIFLHEDFWHVLFNMLFLFWFGRIVGDLIGNKHILPLYLLGGIVGNIVFFITAHLIGYAPASYALGASAGVTAILLASGFLAPDYLVNVLLIGPVRLKYVVAVVLFLDLIAIGNDSNTGGHFAHLGGAVMGAFYINRLRAGRDFSVPVNKVFDTIGGFFSSLFAKLKTPARKPKAVYKKAGVKKQFANRTGQRPGNAETLSDQERLDAILDKIKQSGYDSLTASEKEFLFKVSKK